MYGYLEMKERLETKSKEREDKYEKELNKTYKNINYIKRR